MVNAGMWKPRTLSQKLVFYIVTATSTLLVATVWVGYDSGRRSLESQTNAEAIKQVQSTALTMDSYVDRVAVLVRGVASRQGAAGKEPTADTIVFLNRALDDMTPDEAFGLYIATADGDMRWVDRQSQPKAVTTVRDRSLEWYSGPGADGKLHVSEPFFDIGSKTPLVSISQPLYDSAGGQQGVVGADLSLDTLKAITSQLRFRPAQGDVGEYAFLVSRHGQLISYPDAAKTAGLNEPTLIAGSPEGSTAFNGTGGKRRLYWATAPLTGWKVALNIPESVILAPARELASRSAPVAVASIAGMIILVLLIARRVTRPVRHLTGLADEVAAENYGRVSELADAASGADELGELARSFQTMVGEVANRERKLKQAEEKLQRSEMYFRALIENTSDVVAIFDEKRIVTYASPSCVEVLGWMPQDFVGRDGLLTLEPENPEKTLVAFNEVVSVPGVAGRIELRTRHRTGAVRILEATMHNLLDNPAVAGVVVNLRNVTERRAAENLAKAKETAEAANKAKSAFLANMSHELRTPLNAIIGYSEMLMEEAEDQGLDSMLSDLKRIHGAGRHLLELINAVLDISKIEAGKMELYLETFDPGKTAQDVISIIQPLAAKNSNILTAQTGEGLVQAMHADLMKVRQILFNLLSNACKFTKGGTVTLSVENGSTGWIRFSVADSGIGMTPEQSSRLFQSFTQADASIAQKFGGTGLGLVISQQFCHMMGGTVRLESEPGKGTTFLVDLPCNVVDVKKATAAEPEKNQVDAGLPEATAVVLVIDDDATVHDIVSRSLSREGYRVVQARNGEEGLRLAREFRPDVITLDAMMPVQDGWTVLSALKADPDLAPIPVIMLTVIDNKNLGYALGAREYLMKPINRDELAAAIVRVTSRPSSAAIANS
jgi:PAS domain S-box-containing protein